MSSDRSSRCWIDLFTVLCLIFAMLLPLLLLGEALFYDRHPALRLAYVFAPFWFLPLPGLLGAALYLRSRLAAAPLLLLTLFFWLHFDLSLPFSPAANLDQIEAVKVATYNLGPGQATPAQVLAAIAGTDAAIVGLQEMSEPVMMLFAEELVASYPYQLAAPATESTALLSRYPILEAEWVQTTPSARAFLRAELLVAERTLTVLVVHPIPPFVAFVPGLLLPIGLDDSRQRAHLDDFVAYAADLKGPLIIMTDLNASPQSPVYRQLATHFQDAHAAGRGLGFSYPHDLRLGDTPIPGPFVRLDYILHNEAIVIHSSTRHCLTGSDHCLIKAALEMVP